MGIFGWFKPRATPSSPRVKLIVFGTEETLPVPLQLVHPDGLWSALVGIPTAFQQHPDSRMLLEQPMEPGNYLYKGLHGDVLCLVEQRCLGAAYPGRDQRGYPGTPAGMGTAERTRLEKSLWAVTLELGLLVGEVAEAVLYQLALADRLAMLSEGVVLDQVSHRYYLPGRWRVAGGAKPVDAREHVVLHLEIVDNGILWVHTHGLAKFGRPELEIPNLPEPLGEAACRVLVDLAQRSLLGPVLRPGETVGTLEGRLLVRRGKDASASHYGGPSLELVGVGRDGKPLERGAARGVEAYAALASGRWGDRKPA